jgi:hypothetical protein
LSIGLRLLQQIINRVMTLPTRLAVRVEEQHRTYQAAPVFCLARSVPTKLPTPPCGKLAERLRALLMR